LFFEAAHVAIEEAKSEKVISSEHSSSPERKYLFSVSVHKYFIKTATVKLNEES
jgi:hypothetical protein